MVAFDTAGMPRCPQPAKLSNHYTESLRKDSRYERAVVISVGKG